MNLDRYVSNLQEQLASTAASGGDEARALAQQLSYSLDAATRLVLFEALSDAAGEITREIAPGSVEVRLRGREPEFAVSAPTPTDFIERSIDPDPPTTDVPVDRDPGSDPGTDLRDDTSTSRTTLRLPDLLKARVEKAAAQDGLSLNTWLVRAIADSLEPKSRRAAHRETKASNAFTGWAR